jgi:excinuclease ABC subunit A
VPPAIAIDQTNPVRTSRSTVGTMTELNDHLKLLFARAAQLFDRADRAAGAARHAGDHLRRPAGARAARRVTRAWCSPFRWNCRPTPAPSSRQWLSTSGFTRVQAERVEGSKKIIDVVADRFRLGSAEPCA